MARNAVRWAALLLLAAIAVPVLISCTRGAPTGPLRDLPRDDALRVASFDFAESELLGELFAQALEAAGLPVQRFLLMGSRELVQPALQQGHVDIVPEYLAAALDFEQLNTGGVPADPTDAADRLSALLADDGVSVLSRANAINRDTVVMHPRRADELGVRTILDLARHADDLDFVGPTECPERSACLPRLRSDYGIEFRSFTGMPPGLAVALSLSAGEADVGLMFSSDPLIADHGLVPLKDDRGFGRPEHVVPLARTEAVERHGPRVTEVLERITESLTTRELVAMNRRVARGDDVEGVAADWLDRLR